jgi:predicted membrane-bound mannosyltransferase
MHYSPHLAHVIDAVVDVLGAVLAGEARHAVARVVGEVVDALAAILARGKRGRAELHLALAELDTIL